MSHLYNPWKPEDDAFGRLRVSEPYTLGDYKHLYSIDPDFIDVSIILPKGFVNVCSVECTNFSRT